MTDTYHSISVDEDVMAALEREMRSVHETPNEVLRRLILRDTTSGAQIGNASRAPVRLVLRRPGSEKPPTRRTPRVPDERRESFVQEILRVEFGAGFKVHPPYVMMFESASHLVYFQNFAGTNAPNLWYRLKARPMRVLRATRKQAFVCLTTRVERCAFVLPVAMLDEQILASGWSRPDVEVNIEASSFRWRELDWNIARFRKCY